MIRCKYALLLIVLGLLLSCTDESTTEKSSVHTYVDRYTNMLDYVITPQNKLDRQGLMFSDQGAWFAYSFPDSLTSRLGFSGPFLMTQQNGVWSSKNLAYLDIKNQSWISHATTSYQSHLKQVYTSNEIELTQELLFTSGHTALLQSQIKNISDKPITIEYQWKNSPILSDSLRLSSNANEVTISSSKSSAIGHIRFPEMIEKCSDNRYTTTLTTLELSAGRMKKVIVSQSFIFPEYDWKEEEKAIMTTPFDSVLDQRKKEKEDQLIALIGNQKSSFKDDKYSEVLAKAQLTLQNNWRIPAGEITYEGLFPSYHYEWFNGFWSWDSWKHAVGLTYYNTNLAKEQVKLMFKFQNEDGFVADCVYRDTSIEAHNYRDTKPPLAAWAVAHIYAKDKDLDFVRYMYPKLKKYHQWWYDKRDHDADGICEYGSTDGSLIAAKWESGMDNAIRFDDAKILKNSEGAYSINQESVDLNAYLLAEKEFLATLAKALQKTEEAHQYTKDALLLKTRIQSQFYDKEYGWFYDTSLDGATFIRGEGSEGWTALWANAATQEQAEAVKIKMMDPNKFFTRVPFQTMSADHKKFNPLKGYWRGPNWLDQAYFGVKGLRNYGFNEEADLATHQIIKGAKGILGKGLSIRENYHPITGEGLNAQNFSWSAAHLIMLLQKE